MSKAWAVEIAQQHADDVVLAAGLFKPNAAGNFELSWSGWKSWQIMKARGTYLGERVVLALTPIDVYAVELLFWGRVHRTIRRCARSDLFVSMVATRGREPDRRWQALLIASRRGRLLRRCRRSFGTTAQNAWVGYSWPAIAPSEIVHADERPTGRGGAGLRRAACGTMGRVASRTDSGTNSSLRRAWRRLSPTLSRLAGAVAGLAQGRALDRLAELSTVFAASMRDFVVGSGIASAAVSVAPLVTFPAGEPGSLVGVMMSDAGGARAGPTSQKT